VDGHIVIKREGALSVLCVAASALPPEMLSSQTLTASRRVDVWPAAAAVATLFWVFVFFTPQETHGTNGRMEREGERG